MAGYTHTWHTGRNGRNCAPTKTVIESKGGEIKEEIKYPKKLFNFFRINGRDVNGYVNEKGEIVEGEGLGFKQGKDPEKIYPGIRILLRMGNGKDWITSESYVRKQVESGSRRMKEGSLDYRINGFVYDIYEKMEGHSWGGLDRMKETDLWLPKEVIRFEEYNARAEAEGSGN